MRGELRGIILAGGLGTRLYPLTKVTNKHLLPVYNKPMIYYPVETLVSAAVRDVLLVTGGASAGDFMRLLGNGRRSGLRNLSYAYQEGEGGIAHALSLAEGFAKGHPVIVILGDNLIEESIKPYVKKYLQQKNGARILLKTIQDANRFGVAEVSQGRIKRITEKPKKPKSKLAVTGIYFYDERVFKIIKTLKPSGRGELEITDVNNVYIKEGTMGYDILKSNWTDAGTFESLFRASKMMHDLSMKKRTILK